MINSAGLVKDGITAGCANNSQTVWSCNQGLAIGAFTQLWCSTGESRIPCSSAHDAARHPHRKKTAGQQGAGARHSHQPPLHGLRDLGQATRARTPPRRRRRHPRPPHQHDPQPGRGVDPLQRTRPRRDHQPTRFDTVQIRRQRARDHGRQERAGKQGARPYALRGRIRCTLCERKMQPATIRDRVRYRFEPASSGRNFRASAIQRDHPAQSSQWASGGRFTHDHRVTRLTGRFSRAVGQRRRPAPPRTPLTLPIARGHAAGRRRARWSHACMGCAAE
ncbi:hypothetical protein [Streptomyces sp. NBC_00631]|uniref:hypothetical protein n=1 Tax=Streptomyces sp. NBC_00631 TaxID=2975793 RepID=UPI0038707825